MGKSRIIVAFTIIMKNAYKKDLNAIYIAFPSQILLDTDKDVYVKLNQTLQIDVHLTVGIDAVTSKMTKKDLLILDEADWHLLDEIQDIPNKSYGVLAMTATDVGHLGGNEEQRLK